MHRDNAVMTINPKFIPYMPTVLQILKEHKVKSAYLFGSVLTNNFNDNSDVDFLIDYEPFDDPVAFGDNIWDLRFALEDNLHRDIDLINEANLKNPYFIQEINEKKYKIYG
ncbi:MAG: nucleotidyltransferase domain-containing protein [Bacteroidales bacterium]|nr:nucleotidyltransferase domain-containing protein [Bacteroidales bacterium]